jgi:hypothetical protein
MILLQAVAYVVLHVEIVVKLMKEDHDDDYVTVLHYLHHPL